MQDQTFVLTRQCLYNIIFVTLFSVTYLGKTVISFYDMFYCELFYVYSNE